MLLSESWRFCPTEHEGFQVLGVRLGLLDVISYDRVGTGHDCILLLKSSPAQDTAQPRGSGWGLRVRNRKSENQTFVGRLGFGRLWRAFSGLALHA